MVRLAGMMGTSKAGDAVGAVRQTVAALSAPSGLHANVTGPGSTIADEISAIERQMLGITAGTVVLILVLQPLCTGHRFSRPSR
jgi:putative drug exporter of the RND superfamily